MIQKLLTVVLIAVSSSDALSQEYSIRPLDPGTFRSGALSINGAGQIGGSAWYDGRMQAVYWEDGKLLRVGKPGSVRAINDVGEMAVNVQDGGPNLAYLRADDELVPVPPLPGDDHVSAAAINEAGWIVGSSRQEGVGVGHPFVWSETTGTRSLGSFGGEFGDAYGLNDLGQVVGWAKGDDFSHAFVWDEFNGMVDLGALEERISRAIDINNQGIIVGHSGTDTGEHAVMWDKSGNIVDLARPEFDGSFARAINERGQIVGWATLFPGGPRRAVLWDGGEALVLHDLVPEGCNWVTSQASDIDEQGRIVGLGEMKGSDEVQAFIITKGVEKGNGAIVGIDCLSGKRRPGIRVRLGYGCPGETVAVKLEGGQRKRAMVNSDGRQTIRFRRVSPRGRVEATWQCMYATASMRYTCPE